MTFPEEIVYFCGKEVRSSYITNLDVSNRWYYFDNTTFKGSQSVNAYYDPRNPDGVIDANQTKFSGETFMQSVSDGAFAEDAAFSRLATNTADVGTYTYGSGVVTEREVYCRTSYFDVDRAVLIWSVDGWYHPVLCKHYIGNASPSCLSCHGCTGCNSCYNHVVSSLCGIGCTSGCTTGCTSECQNCQTGCTAGCTTGETSGYLCSECDAGCASGCTAAATSGCNRDCVDACASSCADACQTGCASGCAKGCTDSCAEGCTESCALGCTDGCNTSCFSGCTGSCNNCTNCTLCNGNVAEEQCRGDTTCGGCTQGCTDGCTDGCNGTCTEQCAASCQGMCQNGQNNPPSEETGGGFECNQNVENATCKFDTAYYECPKDVTCSNNNLRTDPCKYGTVSCVLNTSMQEACFLQTSLIIYCKGNCNTAVFSSTYLRLNDEHPFTSVIYGSDPTSDTCDLCDGLTTACPGCTTGCTESCVGCDEGCTACDGCTSGCTSGCTTGCTASCAGGCTSACTNCNGCTACRGCTAGCAEGCTASCAEGCTSGCAGGCTACVGCTAGCAEGCTAGCTGGCRGSCTGCTFWRSE